MRVAILFAILLPLYATGQTTSVQGSIEIPSLVSLNISSASDQSIQINNFTEFASGKILPSYFQLNVKSNRPWTISVMSDTRHLSSASTLGSQKMPVEIISLRAGSNNDFLSLSNIPKSLLHNVNNKIENAYKVDLKIEPPLNYYGGEYTFNIIFLISVL